MGCTHSTHLQGNVDVRMYHLGYNDWKCTYASVDIQTLPAITQRSHVSLALRRKWKACPAKSRAARRLGDELYRVGRRALGRGSTEMMRLPPISESGRVNPKGKLVNLQS